MKKRVVIALGGNAIQNKGEKGTYEEQYSNVLETMKNIISLAIDRRYQLIITHGNGPQVGNILIQNAVADRIIPAMPMFVCGALSQGQIGYLIQQILKNLLNKRNKKRDVATVITQVEVSKSDPAFKNPTKPVGPFYSKKEAEEIARKTEYILKEDAGRGYRRVVSSPEPLNIIEINVIKKLLESNSIVIASGGGGIPVIHEDSKLYGVDAVIDKDKAGALLANLLDADLFVILTAVTRVFLNYGTNKEQPLENMTIAEAKKYLKQGHFAEGSMKPKIEASIRFIGKSRNREVLITHPKSLTEALNGKNGTWIRY